MSAASSKTHHELGQVQPPRDADPSTTRHFFGGHAGDAYSVRVPTPTFVAEPVELSMSSLSTHGRTCPHCGRADTLVGHGFVRGYDPMGPHRVLRGRRLLCSNRHRRRGCGRTVAVLLAASLRGRVANARTLSTLWAALSQGRSPPSTLEAGLTARARRRLAIALNRAQHRIRAILLPHARPPPSNASAPIAQLWAHLHAVLGDVPCLVVAFQRRFRLLFEDFSKNHNLVLIGQPQLLYTLSLTVNEDIRSRVTDSTKLAPDDIEAWVLRELDRVTLPHNTFTAQALPLIIRSGDSTLLEAVRDRTRTVDLPHVNRVLLQPHWRQQQDIPDLA